MILILEKILQKTFNILQKANFDRIIYYWNNPHNGIYSYGFDKKEEKFALDLFILDESVISDIFSFVEEIKKTQKINKGTLTIYANGEYESSFIWDEQADKEYRLTGLFGGLDYLGNTFFVEYFFLNKPEWENIAGNIVITIHILTSIQTTAIIERGDIKTKEVIEFPDYIEEGLKNIHYQTNEGDLKGMLPAWNTIKLYISNSDSFEVDRDVKFEWREENA